MNKIHLRRRRGIGLTHRSTDRRGATLVLIAIMSTALISLSALVLNWSYIELTNTELRSASDAAVKAAVVTLSQTQSQSQARQAAKAIAREYTIGGHKLKLRNSDIQFGNSEQQPDGSYSFVTGQQPVNSARVIASLGNGALTASVPVLFSSFLPADSFDLQKRSTAGRYDHDICVVVDRSASMAWDHTGEHFSYPGEYNDDSLPQNYFKPPHPTESRWAHLITGIEEFKDVIDTRNLNAQIGLVSFAGNKIIDSSTFGAYEAVWFRTDLVMSNTTNDFVAVARAIGQEPLIGGHSPDVEGGADGGTSSFRGFIEGKNVLLNTEKRSTANRTMVLFSDGLHVEKNKAITKAQNFYNNKRITTHTILHVSDSPNEDEESTMREIAEAGGGSYYSVGPGGEYTYVEAFGTIARELPAVLTY